MIIKEIFKNKKDFIEILLTGDEDEGMIDKYLDKSSLFVLFEDGFAVSVCAVLNISDNTIEIKNLATRFEYQNKGYASKLLNFVFDKYKSGFKYLILGTGENDNVLKFYKKRGFEYTHKIKDFFIKNYKKPIFENGKQLIDMIYLKKDLR